MSIIPQIVQVTGIWSNFAERKRQKVAQCKAADRRQGADIKLDQLYIASATILPQLRNKS